MTPIYTTNQLIEYSKQLSRQKEVLKLSTVFNPLEKIDVINAIESLEIIVNQRLYTLKDVEDALKL